MCISCLGVKIWIVSSPYYIYSACLLKSLHNRTMLFSCFKICFQLYWDPALGLLPPHSPAGPSHHLGCLHFGGACLGSQSLHMQRLRLISPCSTWFLREKNGKLTPCSLKHLSPSFSGISFSCSPPCPPHTHCPFFLRLLLHWLLLSHLVTKSSSGAVLWVCSL